MPAKTNLVSKFTQRLSAASRRVKITSSPPSCSSPLFLLSSCMPPARPMAMPLHERLSPALKLAQGTLNLETTDLAVDARSAANLLPLWQLLQQLSSSSSAAPEEISAVVEEIQLNMSAAQIQAIESMEFTQAAIAAPPASSAPTASGTTASGCLCRCRTDDGRHACW